MKVKEYYKTISTNGGRNLITWSTQDETVVYLIRPEHYCKTRFPTLDEMKNAINEKKNKNYNSAIEEVVRALESEW